MKKTKVVHVTTKLKHKFQSVIKCFFPFSLFSLPRYPSLFSRDDFNCLITDLSLFLLPFWLFVCLVGFFFHYISSFDKVNYAQARDLIIRAIS